MTTETTTKEDIKVLRKVIEEKSARNREIIEAVKGSGKEGDPFILEDGMKEEIRANQKAVDEARETLDIVLQTDETKDYLASLDKAERDPEAWKQALASAVADVMGAKGGAEYGQGVARAFLDSEEFKGMLEAGEFKTRRPFMVKGDITRLGRKDVYSDLPSGSPGRFGTIQRDPMVPMPMRTRRVRDLFPSQRTTAAVIEFFRVTGFTNAASMVAERNEGNTGFQQKPQSGLTFTGEQASVRTIAHWEAAHRSALADEPQLQGLIENELLYGLRLIEDDQILNGTGTGQDLLGIRNVPGIQTYAQADVADDNKADALRRAVTLVTLAYYESTGVVMHDGDWEDIELLKDDNGQYLVAVSIAAGGEQRVWRNPVVTTPAMDEGVALIGAFGLGAQLYDREEGSIRIAEEHADFFTANAIVVLAEERLALATKRPEAFVEVTFDE